MEKCIFCQIANKSIPTEIIYENDDFMVFKDVNPKADVHFLVIPKKHYSAISTLKADDFLMVGELFKVAKLIAEQKNIARSGYRLVINSGQDSGMQVNHLHLHILGGSKLNDIN